MKQKGFSLKELLAVIVVLATIVALLQIVKVARSKACIDPNLTSNEGKSYERDTN